MDGKPEEMKDPELQIKVSDVDPEKLIGILNIGINGLIKSGFV